MRWIWDPAKDASNRKNHRLSFELAALVFDDPLATSRRDDYPYEERWQTIGAIGRVIVLVVHTSAVFDATTGEETGRIISARKATPYERRIYEEYGF